MAQMELLSFYSLVAGGTYEVFPEFYKNASLLANFLCSSISFLLENAFMVGL